MVACLAPVAPLRAQTPAEYVALGDRESVARRSAAALERYEQAIAADPRDYAALWKASREAVDLGEVERDDTRRTAYNAKATDYARRAIALMPNDAEGHFNLARALGRTALLLGARDRVRYAGDVRTQALRALELQPRHAGALHIMGVWHAEVMRLGSMQRVFARAFLGGKLLDSANWADATRYLEQSVAVEPNRLVHLVDLARVYRDSNRPTQARASYEAALKTPVFDPNDALYRKDAEKELRALR